MPRKLKTLLKWLIIAYLTYIAALFLFQRSFLYYQVEDNTSHNEQTYEYDNDGVVLRGWVLHPGKDNAIIYYGGNAERVSGRIDKFNAAFKDHSVYLIYYRGYGHSDGEPTEQALYDDALAIFDDIKQRHKQIAVIGRSLGTGIATYVASQREVSHTVLVTPYDSIENIAIDRYIGVPVNLLLKDKFESWKRAKDITSNTLALIAEKDYVVPRRFTDNLIQHFDTGKVISRVLAGTDHYNISHHPEYHSLIAAFLAAGKTKELVP